MKLLAFQEAILPQLTTRVLTWFERTLPYSHRQDFIVNFQERMKQMHCSLMTSTSLKEALSQLHATEDNLHAMATAVCKVFFIANRRFDEIDRRDHANLRIGSYEARMRNFLQKMTAELITQATQANTRKAIAKKREMVVA